MKIKYPNEINTTIQRYRYLYKLERLLLLEHNQYGTAYENKEITEKKWVTYRNSRFKPFSSAISDEICSCRNLLKKEARNDISINASLNDIIEEE